MTNATKKTAKRKIKNVLEQADEARTKRIARGKQLMTPPTTKAKPAEVTELPKATASVVGQHWKTKAGKPGVWRADKLNDAVRNAFLSEGSSDVDAQHAARIATDKILDENHLDSGRWAGKNAGMLSMNLRNVLRGLIRNDGSCHVYGKKIS